MHKLLVVPNHPDFDAAATETVCALMKTVLENNTEWTLDNNCSTAYIYSVYALSSYICVRSEFNGESECLYHEDHRDRHLLQMTRFFARTTS